MNKNPSTIGTAIAAVVVVALLVAGALFVQHRAASLIENKIATPSSSTKTVMSTFVYKNDTYDFTLEFPDTWKNVGVVSKQIRNGSAIESIEFDYNKDPTLPILSIVAYTKSQWQKRLEDDYPTPAYLAENASYIFAYDYATNGVTQPPQEVRAEVKAVLKSFQFVSP